MENKISGQGYYWKPKLIWDSDWRIRVLSKAVQQTSVVCCMAGTVKEVSNFSIGTFSDFLKIL
jgi:hypothetical protein